MPHNNYCHDPKDAEAAGRGEDFGWRGGGRQGVTKADMKKRKFAQGVFKGKSQRAAAADAGYGRGRGADGQASRLVRDPVVQQELGRLTDEAHDAAIAARREVLEGLTRVFRADIGEFLRFDGGVPQFDLGKARKAGKLRLAHKIRIKTDGSVEVELPDKLAAVDRLAKLLGWNAPEKVEQKTTLTQDGGPLSPEQIRDLIADEIMLAEAEKKYARK